MRKFRKILVLIFVMFLTSILYWPFMTHDQYIAERNSRLIMDYKVLEKRLGYVDEKTKRAFVEYWLERERQNENFTPIYYCPFNFDFCSGHDQSSLRQESAQ